MRTFDFRNCIVYEEQVYAWDNLTKTVVMLEINSVPTKDVPEEVLKAILIAANRKEK